MGARINFVFKDDTDTSVVLYSHWGQTDWQSDLAGALEHAKPRWSDPSYATRMMISYFLKDDVLSETGFGLYSITESAGIESNAYDLGEQTIIVDLINKTVTDNLSANWDMFIDEYLSERVGV